MEIPSWLTSKAAPDPATAAGQQPAVRFLDKTLRGILSFINDTVFNEAAAAKPGLLQGIEPRIKLVTIIGLVVILSIQKTIEDIAAFLVFGLAAAVFSRIPPAGFLRKLLPAFLFTGLIALPATLNLLVEGPPLFVVISLGRPAGMGPFSLPAEIAVTEPGVLSAATLLLRVTASVSLVFLITMTTRPGDLLRAVSSITPGVLKPVASISYRYLFFLVRKAEQAVMALRARTITGVGRAEGRRWAASRIGLLFSISMELGRELGLALESRGCRDRFEIRKAPLKLSAPDFCWIMLFLLFSSVMAWRSIG